jgi:hypothetical protein
VSSVGDVDGEAFAQELVAVVVDGCVDARAGHAGDTDDERVAGVVEHNVIDVIVAVVDIIFGGTVTTTR